MTVKPNMGAVLWTSEEDGIDLGPSMSLLAVFKELAQTASNEYPALYGVPQAANTEIVSEDYVKSVRKQAQQYLDKYANDLSEHSQWVLQQLAGGADESVDRS